MALRRRQRTRTRTASTARRSRAKDNQGLLPVLAQAVTQVQNAIAKGDNRPSVRSRFQVIAFVTREERARVLSDEKMAAAAKTAYLKRLDGIAKILAQTGARDTSLLALLGEDSQLSELGQVQRRELLEAAGIEEAPAPVVEREEPSGQVVPQSVLARQLANPFMPPDIEAARRQVEVRAQRLAGWELLGPLLRSFEQSTDVAASCMPLPDPDDAPVAPELHLMKHQAQVVAAAAQGHRTFLLADEPGLGKTAQALLSAQVATAYPLLVVVPNVVKMNWAREVNLWTPARTATVIHSDGESADTFADIVIVNYELLDRHRGWLVDFGFRGMIVDEAHFIKNKTSQRSQNVLEISRRIRTRTGNPLLMALTGTPLINDLDDFLAIWEFLGWIDGTKPILDLMKALEATGLVPGDPGFYAAARRCVIDQGIVRRRKIDVAADIADRRVADLPVELEGPAARSIRQSQEQLTEALVQRYDAAIRRQSAERRVEGIDPAVVQRVAAWARKQEKDSKTSDNVFTMMRKIGQAKAGLAADYTAQLVGNVGKVVFFAKHIDVMDSAEQTFASRGIGYCSIRGGQTGKARQAAIDAFTKDPDVAVAVCSLSAAGVGLNLHVASNLVLAELPWTQAEQTQAIDRVHRIGQDQPVTAWRILAASTIDSRVADLIDRKAGLAARALDGSDEEVDTSADVAQEALEGLLEEALEARSR